MPKEMSKRLGISRSEKSPNLETVVMEHLADMAVDVIPVATVPRKGFETAYAPATRLQVRLLPTVLRAQIIVYAAECMMIQNKDTHS